MERSKEPTRLSREMHPRKIGAPRAFTLVELMLVVVILGVLAAIIVPSLAGRAEHARITAARTDIDAQLSTALDLYEADTGSYPSTQQGLQALVIKPEGAVNWRGPYLKKAQLPRDPWKKPYSYACPGEHNPASYDLWSSGKDGTDGTEDDVYNWSTEEEFGR